MEFAEVRSAISFVGADIGPGEILVYQIPVGMMILCQRSRFFGFQETYTGRVEGRILAVEEIAVLVGTGLAGLLAAEMGNQLV